jgi:Fe-S-cluster containining protein
MASKLSPAQMKACLPYLDQLQALFAAMDRKYAEVAESYGFVCRGCEENCCLTRFYHHTYLEYHYLLKGLEGLPDARQREISQRAEQAERQSAAAEASGMPVRVMCPLNSDGQCALYRFRPMICRLHGVPHEFERPDGRRLFGPGCEAFTILSRSIAPVYLDRTLFYGRLAALEKAMRQALGIEGKFKQTIAQMLLD